ncbi:ribosome assembly RNA-binding protein YhbY [Solemya velesiana gill symbiont]|uniref:RNA-binding protein n=1 Tax=Solemya velesiana gill symbiont TaxID=1918948 RepID=A0A1T2KSJ9_9GAMM|nr:ribosome assembly RNA-binding protein YhbY [Solemya velesiana gill symbiont]OOZ35812.1 RNA-binding protein [Solemya velesiana gill symbiont]
MPLSNSQKRHLKGLAHSLKPVVMTGQHGLTEGALNELEVALDAHELIKVRINAGDREERKQMLEALCDKSGAELVQSIGHIAVLYRHNPEKPKITLPKA